ncbi:LIM domain transcription factor LMO4.2,Rhombotin-2,LIM domain transcription factor LMO4.1,LIM domain transcription factor LMO4,LIM domain transcription factor LMO4-A,Rhombotin-1,LIM domain only protein 3,LIM domain transcription factor LMO4-B [Lepeophtheirus salmonis]|uniref:LIM zinc-binding domain-containing protein n=1 Tax=Lepeophtheirus salmonis TaxID=72036 RepID=A0A7R8H940_LEPSM|nr:LIM domain transcription factor LMO4.2,Rhombotin-2,LIM domain transcription factor LMO4.1,LIM domain transcription factor LMO4,LIM domain transcription factor LMO4-A,Rhombotin-1,LIM domain only protein 3,LIM domain transcription factor LMO4-B [Lepeophtheirus salmonis]CAF2950371.1 LIM domain transcription factor LMO4.2,Rhombotin-2,LIM domain transcription factor LMO4.1,LIM domain transcription factor LMO4,LIM domain transcription factor LMO4-A,Rhombotin-1,LIM domain only protein 3,LIM domain tra
MPSTTLLRPESGKILVTTGTKIIPKEHNDNVCCGKKIQDRYLLKALDMYWHEDCLKCGCCDCRLGEVGSTLYTKGNLILCKRDYLRLFGTTGYCAACNKVIPAFEMVMRARSNVYHLECFACQQCNHRFCVGDRFFLCDNKILCEYDYEERMVFANLAYNSSNLAQMKQQARSMTSSPNTSSSSNSNNGVTVSTSSNNINSCSNSITNVNNNNNTLPPPLSLGGSPHSKSHPSCISSSISTSSPSPNDLNMPPGMNHHHSSLPPPPHTPPNHHHHHQQQQHLSGPHGGGLPPLMGRPSSGVGMMPSSLPGPSASLLPLPPMSNSSSGPLHSPMVT